MDPNQHQHHQQDHNGPAESWRWWSSDLPILPSGDIAHLHAPHISTPSPSAFHTPLSDSYLLSASVATPYHASPHHYWPDEPVHRSMSVNALPAPGPPTSHHAASSSLPPPRQIRFVSTDGRPHTKRRRINAACLTCRKRKTRCSGERPECKTCTENGHTCSGYAEGHQPKSSGDGKGEDDDDDDSSSSSPRKKSQPERGDARQLGPHGSSVPLKQQNPGDSASSVPSAARDDAGDSRSPGSNYTANSMGSNRNRVPYFRYFGPTAIVPGFKQMVVQMKDHRRSVNSIAGDSPVSAAVGGTPSVISQERSLVDIPFYDATDPTPNAHLITHLCETFFTHLGCNYPFLQRERFLRDLEEKRVDAILVDAVCAVAARFSSHPLLSSSNDQSIPVGTDFEVKRPFRGHAFAQRAMSALVDTFPCPTIAVAQACLLLAYDEFGSDHDSGLWMYLGTSIRMAQDLGIQKVQGLQLEGRIGPTPKTAKHGSDGKEEERRRAAQQEELSSLHEATEPVLLEDRRASEQERIDTFYAIFFLDRAVSSGVGRPVTLRDKDIEISFPHRPDCSGLGGWPHPFPPMIRIVHMYGRVADVLNNIKEINQVTPEVLKRLAGMEKDLTGIYQGLSPKLHFNATNFQHYVKAEQGTNFILLHFWFHTLIVLLHQPTLLHSFEGRIQQLFPDSRELSMSSAKTIADILAFAELIDVKSFIGNPFTSQPMYIAACAFLAEAAAHASQPSSRGNTPPDRTGNKQAKIEPGSETRSQMDKRQTAKHTLLATAANQNYQRCYKALKMLDSYWAGCRYILTALDQKSKGLMDPLLFTSEDVDGEMPSTELSFTTPGWRRSTSNSASMGGPVGPGPFGAFAGIAGSPTENVWSPKLDHGQAIGWSLTGMTNSPAPNLSFLYQTMNGEPNGKMSSVSSAQPALEGVQRGKSHRKVMPMNEAGKHMPKPRTTDPAISYQSRSTIMPPPPGKFSTLSADPVSTAEADLLLSLHSPYASNAPQTPISSHPSSYQEPMTTIAPNAGAPSSQAYDFARSGNVTQSFFDSQPHQHQQYANQTMTTPTFGDMLIESQDIDMTDQQGGFTFPGSDMIPWLEYLPQDVLNFFSEPPEEGAIVMPSGPGPPAKG